jgi:hypothetical protein
MRYSLHPYLHSANVDVIAKWSPGDSVRDWCIPDVLANFRPHVKRSAEREKEKKHSICLRDAPNECPP